jgi:hypothetical protein
MERAELPWDQARAGIAEAAEGLSDPILKSWILMGLVAPQLVDAQDLVRVRPTFVQLRSALRRSILEAEATRLAASISAQSGDPDATARLLQRIQEIQRDLRQIKLGLENPN